MIFQILVISRVASDDNNSALRGDVLKNWLSTARFLLLFLLFYSFEAVSLAQNKRVVVIEIEIKDKSVSNLQSRMSTCIRSAVRFTEGYELVPISVMENTLAEKKLEATSLIGDSGAETAAEFIPADLVIFGEVYAKGEERFIRLKLMNTQTRKIIKQVEEPFDGTMGQLLTTRSRAAVNSLLGI